ncbi:MAG: hypothetical protein US72_C0002G0009 [Microgenomates group bacterium GW2011_GWC1_38_12]|nr:MAG: hypothetical protein US72_C0002G0009 [Microgenomates group bacterium GW2011_GWC1_38_12]KKS78115.1 MAG: hypothetical protein UV50_C0001G0025 [Parcubacteria group bacterium GW2011_GWB1_42_9]
MVAQQSPPLEMGGDLVIKILNEFFNPINLFLSFLRNLIFFKYFFEKA